MPQLTCNNLQLAYGGHIVCSNINFTVNAGDYLCIVGENGAGKSTLLKTLLFGEKPHDGNYTFGNDIHSDVIGYIPQQSEIQKDFPASVYEIVSSGCLAASRFKPFYSKQQKELIQTNIQLMGITHLAKRSFSKLSGGQKQRVLLARALCATQRILFLDEPVAGLDKKISEELYNIINDLNKQKKITIVMVTHDPEAVIQYASHVLFLGNPCFFGKKDEFMQSEFAKKINFSEGFYA